MENQVIDTADQKPQELDGLWVIREDVAGDVQDFNNQQDPQLALHLARQEWYFAD